MKEALLKKASEKSWLWAITLIVLCLAVYVPSLGGPFIWDDHLLIVQAPNVQSYAPIRSYFEASFWQREDLTPDSRSYFRPLTILSFVVDRALHGNNPGGFHLTNIALHAATAGMLFALLRRRDLSALAAFAAALAWSWFPRLSECVAWISGRTDVLATLFSLLGLWFFERGPIHRWLAGFCFLSGLLAKEVAVAAVLAAATWSWSESAAKSVRTRLCGMAPLAVAVVVYGCLRARAVGLQVSTSDFSLANRLGYVLEAIGRYCTMMLDAWRPEIQLGIIGLSPNRVYVAVGGVCVLVTSLVVARFRHKLDSSERGTLVMAAVSLIAVLHIVPIPSPTIAADRYLYMPCLALVLLVVPRVARWFDGRPLGWKLGVATYIVSFAPATWFRAQLWSDEVAFWTHAFREQSAANALSRLELGNIYARAGLPTRASALFLDAAQGDPMAFLMARNNASGQFMNIGQMAKAVLILEDLVARAPKIPKYNFNLALVYGAEGRIEEALKRVREARRLSPNYTIAQIYERRLAEQLRRAPETYPETVKGQLARANTAGRMMRTREAVDALLRASELGPLTKAEWESALVYMFQAASFNQLQTMYQRYRQQHSPSPVLSLSFEERAERVAVLRKLWPSLVPLIHWAPDSAPVRTAAQSPLRD